jgi:hypothetical protein
MAGHGHGHSSGHGQEPTAPPEQVTPAPASLLGPGKEPEANKIFRRISI